jgi:hypothetical protein
VGKSVSLISENQHSRKGHRFKNWALKVIKIVSYVAGWHSAPEINAIKHNTENYVRMANHFTHYFRHFQGSNATCPQDK